MASSNSWQFIEAAVNVFDGTDPLVFTIEARGAKPMVRLAPGLDPGKIKTGAIGDFFGHFPPEDDDEQELVVDVYTIRST